MYWKCNEVFGIVISLNIGTSLYLAILKSGFAVEVKSKEPKASFDVQNNLIPRFILIGKHNYLQHCTFIINFRSNFAALFLSPPAEKRLLKLH